MAIKNISTRMKICGRTAKCTGGHSAVEQSGYISREITYSEYDGKTYYPKYAEDLVHNEVLLPENAPSDLYLMQSSILPRWKCLATTSGILSKRFRTSATKRIKILTEVGQITVCKGGRLWRTTI